MRVHLRIVAHASPVLMFCGTSGVWSRFHAQVVCPEATLVDARLVLRTVQKKLHTDKRVHNWILHGSGDEREPNAGAWPLAAPDARPKYRNSAMPARPCTSNAVAHRPSVATPCVHFQAALANQALDTCCARVAGARPCSRPMHACSLEMPLACAMPHALVDAALARARACTASQPRQ